MAKHGPFRTIVSAKRKKRLMQSRGANASIRNTKEGYVVYSYKRKT